MMSILVMGMGYVGTTTALVFAELGWHVSGVDTNADKIGALRNGKVPFHEAGLEFLLNKHLTEGNIRFFTDPEIAVPEHETIFLCVGTPPRSDGSADLQYVRQAAECIGRTMKGYKLIVIKSTVPLGTQQKVVQWIRESQPEPVPFDVVSNPEFLREGSALQDALHPDRIIIGSDTEEAGLRVRSLYGRMNCPVLWTKPMSAELIKYASNAYLATKISFINELARFCDEIGVPVTEVSEGIGLDPRIGKAFLRAGIGYGGSCFPKDVNALLYMGKEQGTELTLLNQVVEVNKSQQAYAISRLESMLGSLHNKTIAVLGIAFKPGTDDLREAPSLAVIARLLEQGAQVRVHDPVAVLPGDLMDGHPRTLRQYQVLEETLERADAAILCTEWDEYRQADWFALKGLMNRAVLYDGRNALDGELLKSWGFEYLGIGRQ